MNNGWAPERREKQRQTIQRWQPWTKTAGPKTPEGKVRVSMNGYKGAKRTAWRAFMREMKVSFKAQETAREYFERWQQP